jgi:hypothetical protein
MSDLLTAFSSLVAYLGDKMSADGFPNLVVRNTPLSGAEIKGIVRKLHAKLKNGANIKNNFVPDVKAKIDTFLATVAAGPEEQKAELLEYMGEYDVVGDNEGMRGGARRRSYRGKSRRSRSRKAANKRKTMKSKRRY